MLRFLICLLLPLPLLAQTPEEVLPVRSVERQQTLEASSANGNLFATATLAGIVGIRIRMPYDETIAAHVRDAALDRLHRAASFGDPHAMLLLGDAYRRGDGVEKNLEEAERVLLPARHGDHLHAIFALGAVYGEMPGREFEALEIYQDLASRGHSASMSMLKMRYYFGFGVARDYEKAAYWELESLAYQGAGEIRLAALPYLLPNSFQLSGMEPPEEYIIALKQLLKDRGYFTGAIDGSVTAELGRVLSLYPDHQY